MSFTFVLSAQSTNLTEKVMHVVHETVGWGVFTAVVVILALGGIRTVLYHRKSEIELTAAFDRNLILRSMTDLYRDHIRLVFRTMFISGIVALCSNMYQELEVGVIDRFNYAVAEAIQRFSGLLHKYVEAAVIDRFNYAVGESAVKLCLCFKKTHPGVLSYNLSLVGMTLVISLMLLLYL
ncbi:MAG: hypothetical protein V1857_02095 [archaeon]